jgi:tetratricopeptide (TPR) repeat protein
LLLADEGQDKLRGQDDDGTKGRTVFGIGLPASVQAASRGAAPPAKAPPMVPPVAPVARPAPPVAAPAKAPAPAPDPVAVRQRLDEEGATMQDIRPLTRPEDARKVEEKRTIVGLPGAVFGAQAPARDVEAKSDVKTRDTGEFTATSQDVHAATRATRVADSGSHDAPREIRPTIKLVGGKPIPGTRYKLLRWLGEGGMGVVYEAEHIDIERRVALKILRAELSQRSDTAQVFRDEAKAATRAGSKNIVEIFDFGELPDGRLFFCMELLSGTDLASQIEDLEQPRMVAILRQVCKGLGAAHKAGIVHRDIKPENIILVQHEGRRDMVKIVDFGVAAMMSNQSQGGPIAGTPQYMAPEQINGGDFDGRLDMYALGCVMYEMLVGHPPFTDENLADVLLAHINRPPPRPSQVKPDRNIPKPLEDVVMRCIEKDVAARYKDMADLEAALCEAQIAAGIVTEWDDLPLPDVDPERRANLVAKMPSAHGELAPRRRWLWPTVAAVAAAAVTGLVLVITGKPAITPEVQAKIDDISKQARDAASVGNYVNQPEDGGPTALVKIEELEGLNGAGEQLADTRGLELRKEFSNQLVTIGDKFWDTEPTRPLSREYYTWAVIFDGTNDRALTRSARSQAEIDDYAKRAQTGKLSASEQASGELLVAMIQPDVVMREQRVRKAVARAKAEAPLAAQTTLIEVARGAGVAVTPEDVAGGGDAKGPDKAGGTGDAPRDSGGSDSGGAAGASDGAVENPPEQPENPEPGKQPTKVVKGPGKKKTEDEEPGDEPIGEVKRDPAKASELASQGKAALAAGKRDEAEALFNQAIGYDRRNAEALIGLSDIFFDRGSSDKAQRFAEKAVAVAPNNGSYRLKLGDAYYNALRYRDALTQYEKAQEFGETKAAQRIAKVKAKLGE